MEKHEEGMEKLLAIEKTITGMIEIRSLVVELKELESRQKTTIEDLQNNVKKYWTFLENIPLRLFIKNMDLSYIYCNQSYADDLKKQPEEIIGKRDDDFFPSYLAEKFRGDDEKVLESGELENIEGTFLIGGQAFIIHMIKAPLKDENGKVVGLMGLFWDISEEKKREEEAMRYRTHIESLLSHQTDELEKTSHLLQQERLERRQVEDRLRQTEERQRWLVEKAPVAIAVIQKGIFKLINPGLIEIFGYSQEELASRPVLEFIHPDDREMDRLWFKETNKGELPHVFFFKIVQKDGAIRWVEDRVDLIHWEGSPATINFFTDITARKQAEDELVSSIQPFRALIEKAQKVTTNE